MTLQIECKRPPYQVFRGFCGAGKIFANFLRFRAVAVSRNSSFAPHGPRTAAALQLFATVETLQWGTEFFGPLLLTEDILANPIAYSYFCMEIPRSPGIGVTLDPEKFAALKEGLEKHCPGMIIQFSTGGRSGAGQTRGEMLPLRPDMASLSVGSNNVPSRVYENPQDLVDWLTSEMLAYDVKPEIEAFDLSHILKAKDMADKGRLADTPYIQFVIGVKNARPVDRDVFDYDIHTVHRLAAFCAERSILIGEISVLLRGKTGRSCVLIASGKSQNYSRAEKKAVASGGEDTANSNGSPREEVQRTFSVCNVLSGGDESVLRMYVSDSGRRKSDTKICM